MNDEITVTLKRRVKYLRRFLLLIILMSLGSVMVYAARGTETAKSLLNSTKTLNTSMLCGVQMQDSVVGYVKSNTNNQIFYLLTVKNTGVARDSFSFSYTATSTPLYTYLETVSGTSITKTPGIEPGASYSFIIRFVVPNGSPAETTNYTNLVATSSICGSSTTDTTHLLTHLYSGKATTGDSCDVQVSKTANVGTVTAGNTITYTITIMNNLPAVASDVFVNDTLASSVSYVSSVATVLPSNLNYSLTYNSTSRAVQFRALSSLGQNQPITFTITVKALCTAVPSVFNKALVTSSTYDNNSANDASSVTTNVTTAYTAPTAPAVTTCYNSTALLTASGAASGIGYKWYSVSSGGSYLNTGSSYTTPVLSNSTSYYVSYYNVDTAACEGPRTAVAVTVKTAPTVGTPAGTTVCPNNPATFTETATGTSLTYQWQVSTNSGSTWSSLTNSSPYSGVTTSTLGISNASYSMNGYQYRCNVASGGCTNTISSGAATLTVRKSYTWLGVNTNWDDSQNWCSGVPDSSSDVTIPSGLTYYPVITGTASTHDIYTGSGSTVTLDSGTIRIFGTITNNGLYDARTGTLNMKGSSAQTIAGSMFNSKTILNLIDGNTSTAGLSVSSTSADTLKISGTLSFGTTSSKLNTGDNIDLLSTASATANVGVVNTNNTITGNVIVDRYINTGTSGTEHVKSWQFLSTPTSGQTIRQSWMENGNNTSGYGTRITSPSGSGFDAYSLGVSLKTYDPVNNNWQGVSSANNPLYNLNGYMLFIRGDRTVSSAFAPATPTILRSKGVLLTGTVGPIAVSPDDYQSVGNPYASIIDFTKLTKDASVDDKFYTWDPYLYGTYGYGGYQTLSSVNDWKPVPGGTVPYPDGIVNSNIQSGQAFFVYSTGSASFVNESGSLSITEACKVSGNSVVNFTRKTNLTSGDKSFLRASLFTGADKTALIADGNAVAFSSLYSNKIDRNDALKILNGGENFGLSRDGKLLAVEARQMPTVTDTIFYYISNVRQQLYQLRFAMENMQDLHLQPVLVDSYTNVYTPLSLTDSTFVTVSFTSDPTSRNTNRFKVIFKPISLLPLTFTSFHAVLTPAGVVTSWKSSDENDISGYEVQYSNDEFHFQTIAEVPLNPLNNGSYILDAGQPPCENNYYRLCTKDVNGVITYSPVMKIYNPITGVSIASMSVAPNPVLNREIQLHFFNEPGGNYLLRLINTWGQTVFKAHINFKGGTGVESLPDKVVPKGIYQLEITKPNKSKQVIKLIY